MTVVENRNKELEKILNQEEYYSLEDYGSFCMIEKSIRTNDFIKFLIPIYSKGDVRVNFPFKECFKEIPMYKQDLKKLYSFIKLIYKRKDINLLVLTESEYEPDVIIKRINSIPFFKSAIKFKLNIDEFPLINFILEEQKESESNTQYAKIYIMKSQLSQKFNTNYCINNINILNRNIIDLNKNINPNITYNFYKNIPRSMPQINNLMNNNNPNCFNIVNGNNNKPQNLMIIDNYIPDNSINNKDNNCIQKDLKKENLYKYPSNNKNMPNNLINYISNLKKSEHYFPLIGLKNVGLTCYMNAILQCFLHINELNIFFIKKYPKDKAMLTKLNNDVETKGLLSEKYYEIVEGVNNKQSEPEKPFYVRYYNYFFYNDDSFSPKDFNDTLSKLNPQFGKYESNDAKDLLLFLIQSMHSELNYNGNIKLINVPKCNQLIEKEAFNFFDFVNNNLNFSIFSYLFYGINKSITICSGCQSVLYNFQFFHFLSLPTYNYKKNFFNIYKGLKDISKVEYLAGDNQFYCQNCKDLKDAKVKTIIYHTPPYLIINIDYGKNKKYKPHVIEFGEVIDLTGFVDKSVTEKTYKLICVCSHIGRSGDSGHYITYCKDKDDVWHEFNDSTHTENIDKEKINKHSPYILIYQRIKFTHY